MHLYPYRYHVSRDQTCFVHSNAALSDQQTKDCIKIV